MGRNMGTADRSIRTFVIAPLLVIAAWAVGFGEVLGIVLLALAAIMVLTSAVGFCPLYRPFGIKTCPSRTPEG